MAPSPLSPKISAVEAGLLYVSDDKPGISRLGRKHPFRYRDAAGKPVRDRETLDRIRALVIPPNWTRVWICPNPRGHLQATGRDARGRKQYRYHAKYRATREETKYGRMVLFGSVLPRIRRRVQQDLKLPGLPREKVLATVVRLMDLAHLRIGNEEYARENQSFGLTTMRNRHVRVRGRKIQFCFRGKSGQDHSLELEDRRLASIVKRCQDLPGYELFEYEDASGAPCSIDSGMVNQYLRDVSAEDITAKDFRTWHGTVHAAVLLSACADAATEAECKSNIVAAIKGVAERLGNRPATCRKYYVHPCILEAYQTGALAAGMVTTAGRSRNLTAPEQRVLRLISRSVSRASRVGRRRLN